MKILITGTNGFIGKNLLNELKDQHEILEINEDIFDDVDLKFAVLSVLSSVNWIAEWYRVDGGMTADEIANRISDFVMGGLRKKLVTDPHFKG